MVRAADAAKIERTLHYRWLTNSDGYRKAFANAQERFADALEGEAIRRSNEGVLEPVFYQGVACGAIRVFSDGLTQFLLRGMKPAKYGNKISAEVNVTGTLDVVDRLNAARKRIADDSLNSAEERQPRPS